MGRTFTILAGLLGALVIFMAGLARADADTAFYTLISSQLLLLILGVVVVSSLFTVLYLVGFGTLGRRWIGNHFSVFVGWNMLRSHRVVPTLGSRLRGAWHEIRSISRSRAILRVAVGAGLLGLAWLIELPSIWNVGAAAASASACRATQVGLVLLGIVALVQGIAGWVSRDPAPHHPALRARAAVTLPTFISIVGVSIGIWALVVVLSVMHGFEDDLREKILRTNAHIVVEPAQASGGLGQGIQLEHAIRGVSGIAEAHAFASGEVMMASPSNIAVNVMVKGMSREALEFSEQIASHVTSGDARWMATPEHLLSDRYRFPVGPGELKVREEMKELAPGGRWQPPRARSEVLPGILLGSELAASLSLNAGSEVQVISPDGDVGPTGLRPRMRSFRVAGVFTTGMYEYDQKLAYMTREDAQAFFNLGDTLNELEVRLEPATDAGAALATVEGLVHDLDPTLVVEDWRARNRSLFSALQLERLVMFIVLGFIILVASLLIVSSLVMLVVEKARDIAVLKSLGASNGAIVRTFLMIGAVIGMVGSASGMSLGVATCLAIDRIGVPLPQEYYISRLPVVLDPAEVLVVGLASFGICLLATVYPSREASRLRPVEGLRHG